MAAQKAMDTGPPPAWQTKTAERDAQITAIAKDAVAKNPADSQAAVDTIWGALEKTKWFDSLEHGVYVEEEDSKKLTICVIRYLSREERRRRRSWVKRTLHLHFDIT